LARKRMGRKQVPTNEYEIRLAEKGFTNIAGVDEVGMSSIAGPVLASAVVFTNYTPIAGLNDSKLVNPETRELLYIQILKQAYEVGIGIVPAETINKINIYHASRQAMRDALSCLSSPPDYLFIDGNKLLDVDVPQHAVPQGDSIVMSISAASIVAKVSRDRLMNKLHKEYPEYCWDSNKGYPTPAHRKAICEIGITSQHRLYFAGVLKKGRWRQHQGLGQ
jgi:ribonuclease HII